MEGHEQVMPGESRTILGSRWHPAIVAAVFLPVHIAAITISNELLVLPSGAAAAFWPASGTLIAALLLTPRRAWPWLLAVSLLVDANLFRAGATRMTALIGLVNVGQGALAAALVRHYVGPRIDFASAAATARLLLLLLFATFLGSLAGALVLSGTRIPVAYWANQQSWWMAGFLGAVVLVPLILSWAEGGLRLAGIAQPPMRRSMSLQFAVLAIVLWHVFADGGRSGLTVLDSPFLVYAALLWIVWSGGPRRVTFALLLVTAVSISCTLAGVGPFSRLANAPFGPILNLQAYLVLVVAPLLIAQASIAEKRRAIDQVRESDARYRSFVEHSSEAIFRFELARPMPVSLAPIEQRRWLDQHARVAESNDAFRAATGDGSPGALVEQHPAWLEHCLAAVPDAIAAGGRAQNVECVLPGPYGLDRTLLVSLSTEVHGGLLTRIWGVARDITHFRTVQRQLEQQQRELRALATELTVTEERARRRIAADLHDGLAQSLVGLKMHIAAIRAAADQGRPLPDLAALELTIAESTAQVRTLMTSLLPPGLYDQGIVAALTWLTEEFARRQRIEVKFEDDGRPKPLTESTTVLVYQAARQLLQNVARHARSSSVTIRMQVVADRLHLTVADAGVGFNVSDLTFLPTQQGGFGLYSIRERLTIIGGALEIDSVPGRGTRVLVTAPLDTAVEGRERARGAGK